MKFSDVMDKPFVFEARFYTIRKGFAEDSISSTLHSIVRYVAAKGGNKTSNGNLLSDTMNNTIISMFHKEFLDPIIVIGITYDYISGECLALTCITGAELFKLADSWEQEKNPCEVGAIATTIGCMLFDMRMSAVPKLTELLNTYSRHDPKLALLLITGET